MRKSAALSLALVLMGVSAARGNLLSNSGFETQGSTNTTAQYWEWGNPDLHGGVWGTASRESWRSHAGTWEATIRGTWAGDNNGGWWQQRPVTPGATYTFSAWFWADSGWTGQSDQGIKIEFYDGNTNASGSLVFGVTNAFSGIGESWVQKTVQATAPTNAVWVRAVVYAYGVGSSGALQFDDVSLVAEPGTMIILSQHKGVVFGLLSICVLGLCRKCSVVNHD